MVWTYIFVTIIIITSSVIILYTTNRLVISNLNSVDNRQYFRNFSITLVGAAVGVFLGFYWNIYASEIDNRDRVIRSLAAAVRECDMNVKIAILRKQEQLPYDQEYLVAYALPIEISNAFLKSIFTDTLFFGYFTSKFRRERLPTIYLITKTYDILKNPTRANYAKMFNDFDLFKSWIDEEGLFIDRKKWASMDKSFSFTELLKIREESISTK